jgi:hypothetical protein
MNAKLRIGSSYKNLSSFLSSTNFRSNLDHRMTCPVLCNNCRRYGSLPCAKDGTAERTCPDCNKICLNEDCYQRHLPICHRFQRCTECGILWDREKQQRHECDQRFCSTCSVYHSEERGCYIEPIKRSLYRQGHNPKRRRIEMQNDDMEEESGGDDDLSSQPKDQQTAEDDVPLKTGQDYRIMYDTKFPYNIPPKIYLYTI